MIKKSLLKYTGGPLLPPFEAVAKTNGQQLEVNKLNLYTNTAYCTTNNLYLPTTPSSVVDDDEVYFAHAICCSNYPFCIYVCGSGSINYGGAGSSSTYLPLGCAFRAGMLKWDATYSKWRVMMYSG